MQKLVELEAAGIYLFHGSSKGDIATLEPRQARSFGRPHGKAAVSASELVEPAIFMAVLGNKQVGGWGKSGGPSRFGFYILDTDMQRARTEGWRGYVYVLEREPFARFHGWEWRSEQAVRPTCVVPVDLNDLPVGIEILDEEAFRRVRGEP